MAWPCPPGGGGARGNAIVRAGTALVYLAGLSRSVGGSCGNYRPWQTASWCLPGGVSGEFVAAMEDVLELYAEADDPRRPRVNFDECSVELHADARPPEPPAQGRPARVDYESVRNGTANLFVVVDPATGRRHVTVTERRTKRDFAEQMRRVCDGWYPDADRVRVVPDNLNTHTVGALYEAFAPAEARRLAAKLEFPRRPSTPRG